MKENDFTYLCYVSVAEVFCCLGNLYRIDYNQGFSGWSWQKNRTNFHDYQRFGTWVFEWG